MKFKKVIIWGYPLNTHTHSYIHASFYKAFKSMGYDTYWFSDENYDDIGFDECLFITAGEQEKNIPLNKNSYYVLHNVDGKKYIDKECKILVLQVNTKTDEFFKSEIINDYTFIKKDTIDTLYTCWATDLLPSEIDLDLAKNIQNPKSCLWIGTFGDSTGIYQNGTELDPFFNSCNENGIDVIKINPWSSPVSFEQNRNMVNSSYISPTIQGPWQIENEYIPCRIFKNISYGHMGYVNSPSVNSLFNEELIYSRDTIELFNKSIEFKNSPDHIEKLRYLMNEVKEKHTYVNRIKQIIECLPE
jgi:hypothetical protein